MAFAAPVPANVSCREVAFQEPLAGMTVGVTPSGRVSVRPQMTEPVGGVTVMVVFQDRFHGSVPSHPQGRKSLVPVVAAPDFILILVVYLGLYAKSPGGALAVFLLGLGGDFASARFVGPTAAGCVAAFFLVTQISNHIYAERGLAVVFVSFLASILKSAVYLAMLVVYTSSTIISVHVLSIVLGEATATAVLSPLVLHLFSWSRLPGAAKSLPASEVYRRS